MVLNAFLLCLGMGLLYYGSEWMVKGSSALALSFSIRPAIVGLTVVAFATSAPELVVSLLAAYKGSSGISLGNILGSNLANIGLVLGSSAFISALVVDRKLVNREVPFMIGVTGLFWIICLDGHIGRIDGIVLLAMLALFLGMSIHSVQNDQNQKDLQAIPAKGNRVWFMVLVLLGMGGLVLGADLMVRSAIFFARKLGLSEVFIGLSIVAVGTSLPELATSIVAGAKGEHDISIGNVVGSNIFNICLVIGCVGLFNPVSINTTLMRFEFPVMFIMSVLVFVFARTRYRIGRVQGFLFLIAYILFVGISYWIGK